MNIKLFLIVTIILATANAEKDSNEDKLVASATSNDQQANHQGYNDQDHASGNEQDYQNENNAASAAGNYGHLSYSQVSGKQENYASGSNNNNNNGYQDEPQQDNFESVKVNNANYAVKGGRAAVVEPSQPEAANYQHQNYDQQVNHQANDGSYQHQNNIVHDYSPNNVGNYKQTQEIAGAPIATYGGFKPIIHQQGQNSYDNSHYQQNDGQANVISYNQPQQENNYQAYPQDYQQQQQQQQQQQTQPQVQQDYQQVQPYQPPEANKVHFQYQTNIGHPQQNLKQQDYPLPGEPIDYSNGKQYTNDYVSNVNIVKPNNNYIGDEKSFQSIPQNEIVASRPSSANNYQDIPYDKASLDAYYDSEIKKILSQYQTSPQSSTGYSQIPSTSATSPFQSQSHNSPASGAFSAHQLTNYPEVASGNAFTSGSDTLSSFPSGVGSLSSTFTGSASSSAFPVTNTMTDYSATSSLQDYPSAALLSGSDIPSSSLSKAVSSTGSSGDGGFNFGSSLTQSYGYGFPQNSHSLFGFPAYQHGSPALAASTAFQTFLPQSSPFNFNSASKYRPTALFGGSYQPHHHSTLSTYAAAASSKLSEVIKAPFKTIRDALFRSKPIG